MNTFKKTLVDRKAISRIFLQEIKNPVQRTGRQIKMAEREGFEPSVELSPHTRLAGERLQPARPSLPNRFYILAEGVGFEPTEVLPSTVFKTAAFNHSAIPPFIESFYLSFDNIEVNIYLQ